MSATMNHTVLIGRLTRDPDYRVNKNTAKQSCRFTLAVDRNFKKQDGESNADFIPIVTFGDLAENCKKYLAKGRLVAVDGSIRTGSYEKNGTKVYTTDVFANNVQFLERGNGQANLGNQEPTEGSQSSVDGMNQVSNNDDELPF